MNESIIVGVVVGVMVAGAGAIISHYLRKWEMEALWAEEERRRKSDRRREGCEEELRVVRNSLDMLMEAIGKIEWSRWAEVRWETRAEWIREVYVVLWRGVAVTASLEDDELIERYNEAVAGFNAWSRALDYNTGKASKGKEDEVKNLYIRMQQATVMARRRAREVLERA